MVSDKDRPIFVVGTPRSGTTLAAQILGRHPRLFMPGETHFFDDVYARRAQLGNPADPEAMRRISRRLADHYRRYWEMPDQERIDGILTSDPAAWERYIASCQSYRDVFAGFMELQMRRHGRSRWGNNAPRDLFNFREILEFFPNAKFVVCVRDLRDFLLSYKGKWRATGEEHVERLKKLYHPVVTSLLWKSSVRLLPALESTVPSGNLIVVRYEDLVTNPERTVRRICAVIGETFDATMLNVESHNSSAQTSERGIFSSSVGRWRKELSATEIAVGQRLGRNQLFALGYELADVQSSLAEVVRIWLTLPFALWRGLRANAGYRGPLLPYLARRLSALFS